VNRPASLSAIAFIRIGSLALLSGCAVPTEPPAIAAPARNVNFLCEQGTMISVSFQGGSAVLNDGTRTFALTEQTVASGMHYAGQGHDLRGKGPELVWTDPAGKARQCRDEEWAMQQPQIQEPLASLDATSWRLVHFQSSDDAIGIVIPPRVERYTMTFGTDGMLAMQLDCNRASSRWQATPSSARGGSLTLSPGIMTKAYCGDAAMDSRIAMDLPRIRTFTLANGKLNLALEADAGIYVWSPAD
jgi:heat shock protein HslJ